MFLKGALCELRALEGNDQEAAIFTRAVNAGLTTRHLLTGSIPMRQIDIQAIWKKEREAGSVEFAIWSTHQEKEFNFDERCDEPKHFGIHHTHVMMESKFIGTCGLYSHRDIYRSWEFRILIFDPSAIGHGIGEEATRLTVGYCFNRLNAHRVWLGCNEANIGAIKCYEKVGFIKEGVLREDLFCFGKYYNAVRYGILENEWKSASPAKA